MGSLTWCETVGFERQRPTTASSCSSFSGVLIVDVTDDTVAISCLPFLLLTNFSTTASTPVELIGTGQHYPGQSAKPPQCLLRHLEADAVRSQRLNSLNTCEVVDEGARWVVKVGENDKDGVDVVQARRRHLSDAPRPVKNLFGAKYHKRRRLFPNDCEQQAQILEVVRVQKDIA